MMRCLNRLLLLAFGYALISAAPAAAELFVGVSVGEPPPPLPVYDQPPLPGPGYLWVPGYWAWDVGGGAYYWVPGTWLRPPRYGVLWTPAWWDWEAGVYVFHPGYWGPHIGFYGGINYGFGYFGVGYEGGYWAGRGFRYNRAYNNFGGVRIANVYNRTV